MLYWMLATAVPPLALPAPPTGRPHESDMLSWRTALSWRIACKPVRETFVLRYGHGAAAGTLALGPPPPQQQQLPPLSPQPQRSQLVLRRRRRCRLRRRRRRRRAAGGGAVSLPP